MNNKTDEGHTNIVRILMEKDPKIKWKISTKQNNFHIEGTSRLYDVVLFIMIIYVLETKHNNIAVKIAHEKPWSLIKRHTN